eukprot:scaffold2068_cov96-Cylindrotheca_fusiformis.AAC.23
MKRSHDQYSDRNGRYQRHGGDQSRRRYDERGPDHQHSDRRSGPGHSGGSGHGGSRYGDPNGRDERRDNQYDRYGSGDSYHQSSSGGYYGPSGRRSGPGHSGGSGHGGSRYGDPNRRDERRDNQYDRYGSGDSYHQSSSGGYYGPFGRRSGPGQSGGSGHSGSRYGDPNRRDERRDNQYGRYGSGDAYHRSSSGGDYDPSGSGIHERLHGSRVESSSYRPRMDRQRPDCSGLTSCTTNIVPAEVTEGFQFFLYTVNIQESNGEQMESRHRRKMLFHTGFWDNLLKGLHIREKNDLRRVVFFSGSYFCSGRPIPGLERSKLPVQLPLGKEGELGETVEIVQVFHYLAPDELRGIPSAISQNEVAFDSRCADCTRCFADQGSLLQHW